MTLCAHCGKPLNKSIGHINRAKKLGLPMYCNRVCFGLGHRVNRTEEQKKKIKAEYDKVYRYTEKSLAAKKAYNQTPAGRAMQKRNREQQKENHRKYIQSEQYRKWKHDYDQQYHAKNNYGDFWEAALVLRKIEEVVLPYKYEIRIQNGILNKSQKRKRQWNSRPKI